MSTSVAAAPRTSYRDVRERRLRLVGRLWPLLWVVSATLNAWQLGRDGRWVLALLVVANSALLGVAASRSLARIRHGHRSDDPLNLLLTLAGAATAVPCGWALGEAASSVVFYCVATAALVLEVVPAGLVSLAASVAVYLASGHQGWRDTHWLAVGLFATGVAAALGRRGALRGREARQAEAFAHQMEINDERNRMARDLHDILGHSLTVITLKSELAERLVDVDPAAAKQQLAELRSLSRSALADVRATVNNYRELSLAGELARAANALQSAQVTADLPSTVEVVGPELRELFAWALREGVTNVVRHAQARHCWVRIEPCSITVADDGVGIAGESDGHGLEGLRQRCAASGAELSVGPGRDGRGTRLVVTARDLSSSPLAAGDAVTRRNA